MISSYRAFSRSFTFWQFFFWIFTYIISVTLLLMARLTKMSVPPTKPLGCWATKFTFKLNKVFSMFWAVLYWDLTTVRTNEFFRFKWSCILRLIHSLCTILPSSEISIFAFKTFEVSIYSHSIFTGLLKIRRFRILQSFVLVTTLKF